MIPPLQPIGTPFLTMSKIKFLEFAYYTSIEARFSKVLSYQKVPFAQEPSQMINLILDL